MGGHVPRWRQTFARSVWWVQFPRSPPKQRLTSWDRSRLNESPHARISFKSSDVWASSINGNAPDLHSGYYGFESHLCPPKQLGVMNRVVPSSIRSYLEVITDNWRSAGPLWPDKPLAMPCSSPKARCCKIQTMLGFAHSGHILSTLCSSRLPSQKGDAEFRELPGVSIHKRAINYSCNVYLATPQATNVWFVGTSVENTIAQPSCNLGSSTG